MDGAAITVSSILPLPDDAPAAVRRRLGLGPDEALRIAYVPGPGDVAGSLAYWRDGAFDPRVPIVAYSTMFYELARKLDATALVVSAHGAAGDAGADIRVVHAERPAWRGRFGYLRSIAAYSRAVERHLDGFAPHVAIVAADFPMSRWRRLARKGRLFILSAHNI